ncbi:MAG: hypothetical protein U0572_12220 [Phycisphaerales bacterium]
MTPSFASLVVTCLTLVGSAPPAPTGVERSAPPTTMVVSDAEVSAALDLAGANRGELERFLGRYDYDGGHATDVDVEKRDAARWLVANMPGHGFAVISLETADGTVVPFDATEHRNLADAKAALRTLERERGPLDFRRERFVADVATITADQLIGNHELAFATRRHDAWAAQLDFRSFCEFVLPYRGSEEALDPRWRAEATELVAPVLASLRGVHGDQEAAPREPELDDVVRAVRKAAKSWVKFRQLYYLHPTDQNWTEMRTSREGRCEDQTNMVVFAARAAGVVVADDFTPFWADRDNNHAWDVALDANGRGSTKLAHRAAKVYRRVYGRQPDAVGGMREPGERMPSGLAANNVLDVTAQYVPVTDVALTLVPPPGQRFAYLCVFNGGEWRAVAGVIVRDGAVTFHDVGRDALYLPAWFDGGAMVPAGAPFRLTADGERRAFEESARRGSIVLATRSPNDAQASESTAGDSSGGQTEPTGSTTSVPPSGESASVRVRSAGTYDVLAWSIESGAWRTIASVEVTKQASVRVDGVPIDALLWVREAEGERLERPFAIDNGHERRW